MRAAANVALITILLFAVLPRIARAAAIDLGAELRLQGEAISSDMFGIGNRANDSVLQRRAVAQVDIKQGHPRLFLQLGVSATDGRNGGPSPIDESDPDAQQAFVEFDVPAIGQLRAGRQEWSFGSGRLVSVRDGPNIRRAFDAVQLERAMAGGSLRLLVGRPVENRPGSFDDRRNDAQSLAGIYATWPLTQGAGTVELYWLDLHRDGAQFASGSGRERRDSWGFRWAGEAYAWSFNTEAVVQTGDLAGEDIRAWTIATDTRYRLGSVQLGLKADIASGDGDLGDGHLQTFNALYPNPSYFSDVALISPTNLIDLQPFVQFELTQKLSLYGGWDVIWKHRRADAIYTTPVPLTAVPNTAGGSRFIGQQLQTSLLWQITDHLSLEGCYVRFFAGSGLREAGGDDVDFAQLKLTLDY